MIAVVLFTVARTPAAGPPPPGSETTDRNEPSAEPKRRPSDPESKPRERRPPKVGREAVARRSELEHAIRAALARRSPAPSSAARGVAAAATTQMAKPAPAATGDSTDSAKGSLDKEYIREAIQEVKPLIGECYEMLLESQPEAEGRLVAELVIAGDESVGGIVEESRLLEDSTLQNPSLDECVRETLYTLELPAPKGGGRVVVRYPFHLAAKAPSGDGQGEPAEN